MIPDNHKTAIVDAGINFLQAITHAYGTETGLQLWESMNQVLDDDVRGQVLLALLSGRHSADITIRGISASPMHMSLTGNIINMIKVLRSITNWGLKESKDAVDRLREYHPSPVTIPCTQVSRSRALQLLEDAGFLC
mgnify:CR=1 FL=1